MHGKFQTCKHNFFRDRDHKNEMEIKYCPVHFMFAHFFTKPLQGDTFVLFVLVVFLETE